MHSQEMPDTWRDILLDQDGVVRLEVAVRALGRPAVRHRLVTGAWQRVHLRVLVTHSGPLSPPQTRWAAVLHAGADAVLSHATAAELGGLQGFPSRTIHVSVPNAHQAPAVPGVRVHRRRGLGADGILPAVRPHRMRIEHALLDMASTATSEDAARAVLAAGVQQRLTTAARLRAVLDRLVRVRWRRLISETLADVEGGSHSLPELRFVRALRAASIPLPDRQVARQRASGRWYLDAHWEHARLTVEIDGTGHLDPRTWLADLARGNELTLAGDRVLRFPSFAVRDHPDDVVAHIALALTSPLTNTIMTTRGQVAATAATYTLNRVI